jgi:hypothetical protein
MYPLTLSPGLCRVELPCLPCNYATRLQRSGSKGNFCAYMAGTGSVALFCNTRMACMRLLSTHGCDMSRCSRLHSVPTCFLSWMSKVRGTPSRAVLKACGTYVYMHVHMLFSLQLISFLLLASSSGTRYTGEGMYTHVCIYEAYASTAGGTQPGTSGDLRHGQCREQCVCQVCFDSLGMSMEEEQSGQRLQS